MTPKRRPLTVLAAVLAGLAVVSCGASASRGYEGAVSSPAEESLERDDSYEMGYDEIHAASADVGGYAMPAQPAPSAAAGGAWNASGEVWAEDEEVYHAEKTSEAPVLAELTPPGDKAPAPAPEQPPPDQTKTDATKKAPERIILYVAEMNIAVFRIEERIDEIRSMIKTWDGYMISLSSNRIVFRVPAGTFEEALSQLEDLGDVTYRNVNGTDVTDEYRDLRIRLKNSIAVRDRLLELLSEAKTIEESLKVEHELERITEKIELMKGRLKYLDEAASYSKITVHLAVKKKAKKPIPPLYAPFKWIQDVGLDKLFNF
jgi:hypothetical protein